jgi:hypothetical protein
VGVVLFCAVARALADAEKEGEIQHGRLGFGDRLRAVPQRDNANVLIEGHDRLDVAAGKQQPEVGAPR